MAHQSKKSVAHVTSFALQPEIKGPVDTNPSELQPPGVDTVSTDSLIESEPQSLEEALLGE